MTGSKAKKRQQAKDEVPQKWRISHPNNMVCIVSPILRGSQHLSTRPISSVKSRAFRKLVTGWSACGEKSGSKAFPMIKGCADASQAPRLPGSCRTLVVHNRRAMRNVRWLELWFVQVWKSSKTCQNNVCSTYHMVQDDYQWLERIAWSLVHWRVCHSCPQFPTLQNVDILVDPCSIWQFSCACFGVHRRSGFNCSRPERNCKKHKRRSFSCHGCLRVEEKAGDYPIPLFEGHWKIEKSWSPMGIWSI